MRLCVAVLFFAGFALGQPAARPSLSGRITDSITHQPIEGAQVSYGGPGQDAVSTSDANGVYSFHMAASEFDGALRISSPGYAILDLMSTEKAMVRLKPGASETRDFELSRAANISGHLVDRDSGKPISGFYVKAIRRFEVQGHQLVTGPQAAPSAADGSFTITRLVPGSYSLEIDPPMSGGITFGDKKPDETGYGTTWFPGVPRAEMAVPVALAAGESREIEIRLQKRQLRRIGGMFQVPEGMEGDGITISVSSLDRQTGVEGEIPKAGPFHIDGLDDGAYRILATTKAIPGRSRAFVSRTLELTDRNIDDLRLVMRPGVALRAVVTMAEEKADTPAGIRFMPLALDGWMPFYLDEPGTGTTADRLRVAALPPGEYWTDSLMLPSGYAVVSANYNGQPVSNSAIHVEAPDSAVTYLLTSLPGRVTGTVRDADGKPVPDASVVLLPAWVLDTFETFDPQTQRTIGLMRMAHVQNSDTNGGFHFSDLAPGLYKAVALTGNARRSTHDLIFLRDRLRLVDALVLERGQTANLDIHVIE